MGWGQGQVAIRGVMVTHGRGLCAMNALVSLLMQSLPESSMSLDHAQARTSSISEIEWVEL